MRSRSRPRRPEAARRRYSAVAGRRRLIKAIAGERALGGRVELMFAVGASPALAAIATFVMMFAR